MTKASNEKCFRSLIMMALAIMLAVVAPMSVIAQGTTKSQTNDGKRIITGIVYDDEGAILPGASVYVKGDTKQSTITNNDGKFTLTSNPQPIGFSGILLAKRQNSFYCTYFLHNRNVADTKSPYPIKRLEVIRWFNQKSMVFNQSLS